MVFNENLKPPNPQQSLSGQADSAHRALYFSTQWRNGVVFTSRSEILCGALEECLASHLIYWLHSGWMMSQAEKNIHMSRHRSHEANISARLKLCNQDSSLRLKQRLSYKFLHFPKIYFQLAFFPPWLHWCSCTRNINPTWEVLGPVAKASMGHPGFKPQPCSVMSHGYKDFPTRIRSHDPSAAVEMLIWFDLWCEGVTNYCSSERRQCNSLSGS